MFKKDVFLVVALAMVFSLSACGPSPQETTPTPSPTPPPTVTPSPSPTPPPGFTDMGETLKDKINELDNLMNEKHKADLSEVMKLGEQAREAAMGGDIEEAIRLIDNAIAILKSAVDNTTVQPPTDPEDFKEWVIQSIRASEFSSLEDMGYNVPSWQELDRLRCEESLDRRYPDEIKGLFDPGPISNTFDLICFNNELKELGINTYFVIAEYELGNDGIQQFLLKLPEDVAKRALIHRIIMAKKEGYSVIVVPDYPSLFSIGKQNYDIDVLEPQLEEVALEWAKVAEEYQVEYFAPINEYEHLMFSNGYDLNDICSRTNAFYERITPKLREIYKGKVVYKFGNLGPWDNFNSISTNGADLFGFGNAYAGSPEDVGSDVRNMVKKADEISSRDGVPWFISEFLVFTQEDITADSDELGDLGLRLSAPYEEYYRAALDAFNTYAGNPVGFTFMGWSGTGRVRGTGVVALLREFFND